MAASAGGVVRKVSDDIVRRRRQVEECERDLCRCEHGEAGGRDRIWLRMHHLRVRPAMEAGVSNHVWSLQEIIGVSPQPVEIKDHMNDLQTTVKGRTLGAWISSSTSTKQLHQPLTSQNDATNILPFSFSSK